MLIEPMIQQLHTLRLRGMAAALEQLLRSAQHQSLSFEERLSVMIQHEITDRDSKRLAQRLRWAKLPQNAAPALGEATAERSARRSRYPHPARTRSEAHRHAHRTHLCGARQN